MHFRPPGTITVARLPGCPPIRRSTTPCWGFAMLFARYWVIIPVLAIAGSLAAKKSIQPGAGTLPTHTLLFVFLLVGTVIVVGALTFLPALALGPVVEHLQMIGAH